MASSNVSVAVLRHSIKILLSELYPNISALEECHYSFDDILNQIIFELIKEEYKEYAEKHTVQYYLDSYDSEHFGTSRKYTRALQYVQFYRDLNNSGIEETFGIRLPELEAQDMSGSNKFLGHKLTEQEFLGIKMQAECKLLNKLHGKQIDSSNNVRESDFRKLFEEYERQIAELEPPVNTNPNDAISRVFAYYGTETYFLTEFLYWITLAAEEFGFPKEIPVDRILSVCSITPYIPETSWCPPVLFADLCIIPKWKNYVRDFFAASDSEWHKQECLLLDCKQMKNIVLQRGLDQWIEIMHSCDQQEKSDFLFEHYWLWEKSPNYEWPSERIVYYRKLHAAIMKDFPKPHIK